ncbi:hypothetical protein [Ilumatobacter sp.]|uniref:hypothetical protein n=1 Tax=Ilumatobacter sp. TaxID=1967498 RepID=UPI003C56BC40
MPQFMLIGLCEPTSDDDVANFERWFVDEHIEDTTNCPIFVRGRVFKLDGPHLEIETPSQYMSVYEVEAESYDEAERILNEWQADPDAWAGRAKHLATRERLGRMPMRVRGSGWYRLLGDHQGPASP